MSSSSEQSYEDDFENSVKEAKNQAKQDEILTSPNSKPPEGPFSPKSKPIESLTSPKSAKPPAKDPRREVSPKFSEISKPGYRPNEIFEKEVQPGKKSLKNLEKENQQLRSELKFLNNRISSILEANLEKPLKNSKKTTKDDKSSTGSLQKKLLNYELEYLRLKQIYQKFNDVECLIVLKNEVKDKKHLLETLEKDLKILKISIENKQKDLNNFDHFELPEEKLNHKHLMTENMKIIEQVETLERNLSKIQEKKEKTSKVEEDLQEKYEKLSVVASNYIVELGDVKSKELFESSKKTLENLLKVSQVSFTQLRIKAHDLKNEEKRLDQELKKFQSLLKEKEDSLNQVRTQLDDAVHLASASKLDQLATLLKSNSRSISTLRSVSPRAGTMVGMKSDSSMKDLNKANLMNSWNFKNSEKAESQEKDSRSEQNKGKKRDDGEKKDADEGVLVFEDNRKGKEYEKVPMMKEVVVQVNKDSEKNEFSNKNNELVRHKDSVPRKNQELVDENSELEKQYDLKFEVNEKTKKTENNKNFNIDKELKLLESELDKSLKDLNELDLKKESPKGFLDELEKQDKPKGGFFEELDKSIKKSEFLLNLDESFTKNEQVLNMNQKISKLQNEDLDLTEEKSLKSTKELQFSEYPPNPISLPPSEPNPFASIPLANPKAKRNRDHLFK